MPDSPEPKHSRRKARVVALVLGLPVVLVVVGLVSQTMQFARRNGWGLIRAPFAVELRSAEGIKRGDLVRFMGFDAGEVVRLVAPSTRNRMMVEVHFTVWEPWFRQVGDDAVVTVKSAAVIGGRTLELFPSNSAERTPAFKDDGRSITHRRIPGSDHWEVFPAGTACRLEARDLPDIADRVEEFSLLAGSAIRGLSGLTNSLNAVLLKSGDAAMKLDALLVSARPLISNAEAISRELASGEGSLGRWLLAPDFRSQMTQTMARVNAAAEEAKPLLAESRRAVLNTESNLAETLKNLDSSLVHLATITSNLSVQVSGNTNLISNADNALRSAQETLAGLRRHWLLRSAFRTNATKTTR